MIVSNVNKLLDFYFVYNRPAHTMATSHVLMRLMFKRLEEFIELEILKSDCPQA